MRIGVDIPEAELKEIDRIAAAQHRSRDAVIQDAVGAYIAEHWPARTQGRVRSMG